MPPPTFATPLPQSPRSDILEWRFPKPYHNLTLTGRSRAAWHTSFVIPQLNLLLDAGLIVNNFRPKHIFLTHGHSDHTLLTPAFAKRSDPPDIYCPAEMKDALDNFINAKTMLSEGGGIWPPESTSPYLKKYDASETNTKAEPSEPETETSPPQGPTPEPKPEQEPNPNPNPTQNPTTHQPTPPPPSPHPLLQTHTIHGLHPSTTITLPRLPPPQSYTATAFACDHTVPCLGYVFHAVTRKLKPEYRGLSGAQLKALREQSSDGKGGEGGERGGVELTAPVATPVFAFLGDTTAKTLAAGPEWLGGDGGGGVRVVITECSFLWEEHRGQAERTRHTIWADLEPVVRRWPGVVFVLMHFSLRYSDEERRQI
ncbi:beta-lactamase-like protein [Chaetomium fimeti]|uniref:Beta-lactamase-like protein n=1 Tax=Chaetomium fimeti TaxID=1854472 RepID=A0AAE0LT07_9PEZI|nr:beta-lactamase-like protein [Chaetomium fimeti]